MADPLLSAHSIVKSFAGVHALKGVSFDVHAGEVHALVGENGAGKSTLIKVMTGAEAPDDGRLVVGGVSWPRLDPVKARRLGIAVVHQQPSLFPDLSVSENLAIGVEAAGVWRRIDWQGRRARARDLLARTGAAIDPDRRVDSLSMPEQQLVEIARALGADATTLILDEPTASLTGREVDLLLAVLRRLRADGVGIVYITHRLDDVLAIADRVTVLRDGRTVGTRPAAGLTAADLVRLMIGDDLYEPAPRQTTTFAEPVLEVRALSCRAAGIRDVSLIAHRGEILGMAGLVGSGRTQLAETIFGITPADSGEVIVKGARLQPRTPAEAMAVGLAYVPEDRRRHGVLPEMSIAASSTLASLGAVSRYGVIQRAAERDVATRYIAALQIKASGPAAEVRTLSGGNQQKVAVARWLMTNPSVLILDEPTQGVDVRSKGEIHRIIRDLADQGLAVIVISSDATELLALSDRIAVMRDGTLVAVLPRERASQHDVLAMALGTSGQPAAER